MRWLVSFLTLALPFVLAVSSAPAQTAFGAGPVAVQLEWRAQDRGDGSGEYHLEIEVTEGNVSLVHALSAERNVEQEITRTDFLRVLVDENERARANSDPAQLGTPWADVATRWLLPFSDELVATPRTNYRPNERLLRDTIHAAVADANVSTRRASDGRTTAEVTIPGEFPADVLAEKFLSIREALREADIGLARLRIRGTAVTPAATPGGR